MMARALRRPYAADWLLVSAVFGLACGPEGGRPEQESPPAMTDTLAATADEPLRESEETLTIPTSQNDAAVTDLQRYANVPREPLESARTVYVFFGAPRPLAFVLAWPGAERGAAPRLEGRTLLYGDEGCEVEIFLMGEPDSALLGPRMQPLAPVAQVSAAEGSRETRLAFPPDDCPTGGPKRYRRETTIQLRLEPLLRDAIRDSLERERGAGVALSEGSRVQVWDYPDGTRLALVNLGLVATDEPGPRERLLAILQLPSAGPPKVVHLRSLGPEGWSPIGLADVDGQGRAEIVYYAGDHGYDPATVRIAIFGEDVDGRWSLWRLIPIFQTFPYEY